MLQHLGSVAGRRGEHLNAAHLLGASNRLYEEFGLTREFTERSLYDRTVDEIRHAIGDEGLRQGLEQGATLPFNRAVEEALAVR